MFLFVFGLTWAWHQVIKSVLPNPGFDFDFAFDFDLACVHSVFVFIVYDMEDGASTY